MPVTITYDFSGADSNDLTTIRSMFERLHWRRLGGSVFRYDGVADVDYRREDWLNHVIPALMFFRSYVLAHEMNLAKFTLDSHSVVFIDESDPTLVCGTLPVSGAEIAYNNPTNHQCSQATIREFVDEAIKALS